MKIAVIGTHGTGKTTLCHDIVAALRHLGKDAQVMNEVARVCPFQVNEGASFEAQYWVLATQIKQELEYHDLHDIVLCDRGVVDNYMYLLRKFPDKAAFLTPLVVEHCRSYDLIIKTVPDNAPVEDGFRSVDTGFQDDIERMLTAFLEGHGIPHVVLRGEGRVEKAIDLIGARK
jgi:nicotinamide riboside kinase